MRRYKINGTKDNEKHYCPTCKKGKVFFNEQHIKTDLLGSDTREGICGVCDTMWKQTLIKPALDVDVFPGVLMTPKMMSDFRKSFDGRLTPENNGYLQVKISQDFQMEEKNMDLTQEKEIYEKTMKCPGHKIIKSEPFRTSEGQFTIDNCAICRKSSVEYKGRVYTDSLFKLVNFLAMKGTANEEFEQEVNMFAAPQKENLFANVGKILVAAADKTEAALNTDDF